MRGDVVSTICLLCTCMHANRPETHASIYMPAVRWSTWHIALLQQTAYACRHTDTKSHTHSHTCACIYMYTYTHAILYVHVVADSTGKIIWDIKKNIFCRQRHVQLFVMLCDMVGKVPKTVVFYPENYIVVLQCCGDFPSRIKNCSAKYDIKSEISMPSK